MLFLKLLKIIYFFKRLKHTSAWFFSVVSFLFFRFELSFEEADKVFGFLFCFFSLFRFELSFEEADKEWRSCIQIIVAVFAETTVGRGVTLVVVDDLTASGAVGEELIGAFGAGVVRAAFHAGCFGFGQFFAAVFTNYRFHTIAFLRFYSESLRARSNDQMVSMRMERQALRSMS